LQSRRVPEQNAGTATTWSYNTDDTIQSRTDARGASTTFTYTNGRHLPNVVTHTLAGASTIVESFSYDAAANRMSFCQMLCMEDLRRRPCEPPLVDRL
jgi:YD repeat-containing protein